MFVVPWLVLLVLVLGGCEHDTASFEDPVPATAYPVTHDASAIQVYVFVLMRPNGTGNESWTHQYVRDLLDASEALTAQVASFHLAVLARVKDVRYDTETMQGVYARYTHYQLAGAIVVLIPPPGVPAGWGAALQGSFPGEAKPYVVMRRKTDAERLKQLGRIVSDGSPQNAIDNAEIFLHELGHTMGFPENSAAQPLNADTWYVQQPQALRTYAAYLATVF